MARSQVSADALSKVAQRYDGTSGGIQAALLLAQGVGRLHRSTDDKGVVAVLDPRLATARYAGYLRASLPPFWETTNPEVVRKALTRIRDSRP